jgi:single-strand DNA-binding protein
MAGYLNKVQLIGNLGRDPEVRSLQSGGKVVPGLKWSSQHD